MKQAKKDIKYIIKRILIGAGIAILLFNAKKCSVYAQATEYSTFQLNNNNNTATWVHSSSDISSCNYNATLYSFEYENVKYNLCIKNTSSSYTGVGITVFLYQNDLFVGFGSYNKNYINNNNYTIKDIKYTLANNRIESFIHVNENSNVSLGFYRDSSSGLVPSNQVNGNYNDKFINLTSIGSNLTATDLLNNNIYENFALVYSSLNVPVYFNDNEVQPPNQDPTANLTRVDLTGYAGVIVVPKSFETMLSDYSHIDQPIPGTFHTYIDLSIYTQYCTRQTLINLTNTKNLMINDIGVSTGSLGASISGTCPDEPTETIMTYQYDMYAGYIPMGVLVYNNTPNWDSGFATTQDSNYYGTAYVWYDSNVYDIYLVENLDSFSADITFIDYDGQQKTLHIDDIPDFVEMAQYAIDHDINLNKSKANSLFSFVQVPFAFLNLISVNKCQALRFPFPNSNQIIIIPCMSQTYSRIGGTLINTISVIINGLIIYRCIINMINITQAMLDADDDKLEVLEL